MSENPSTLDPRRAEIILYGLGATIVILFAVALVGWDILNGRYDSLARMGYGGAIILLCLAGLAIQLRLGTHKSFRVGSWLILAVLLFEVTLFVFLKAYYGAAPVPATYRDFQQYQFHPAMVVVPRPEFHGVVDRVSVSHNSVGARNPGKFDPSKPSILTIGGSTTYNIAVDDKDTWTAHLAKSVSPRFNVLNFGISAHSSSEHIIFTALRASAYNPRCIIYYFGWNDIRSSHLTRLEPDYSNFHGLGLYRVTGVIGEYFSWSAIGSLARILANTIIPIPPPDRHGTVSAAPDPRLEAIYRRNIRLLAAISKTIGARPIFVPQVLNYVEEYRDAEQVKAWIPFVPYSAVPAVMRHFNEILRETAEQSGSAFIGAPIEHQWTASDFVDEGHFSPRGTRTFASLIAPDVKRYCE